MCVALLAAGWFWLDGGGVRAAETTAPATIGPIRNQVQYLRYVSASERNVAPAREGIPLAVRDRVRTLEDSAATILITGRQAIQLGELSSLEIMPQETESSPLLELLRGALYFFSRDKPREVKLRTPHATGAPRGTEFALLVDEHRTVLALYDGEATLSNDRGESLPLRRGEMGIAEPGQPLRKEPLKAKSIIQWWLYYPGVLDVDELEFTPEEAAALKASTRAYREGDPVAALALHPGYPSPATPASDAGKLYLAGLYLGAGQAGKAEALLTNLPASSTHAAALRWVMAAVRGDVDQPPEVHTSASEWLGLSYYYQARRELAFALHAARRAVRRSTNFGYAWARVAELQFSFGRAREADEALERALTLSPRNAQAHAQRGFVLLARGSMDEAATAFETALQLDSTSGSARLGRGLLRMHRGQREGGRSDLQAAAVLEPERSLFRSYLGKAFADAGLADEAAREYERARQFDKRDPTPWLYSALLYSELNELNTAVAELEQSIALNDNRAVYRSQLLLDKDRAVRGANLARIYREAGLAETGLRAASRAVLSDYANHSAHLFLANSYNALRDPNLIGLRYETATFSEYLLANLLSPVGGTALSPQVSQQEYSRLFQRNRIGLSSTTTFLSDGEWVQDASQFGTFERTAYALDVAYRSLRGDAPNTASEQLALSAQIKGQLTPQDSIYFQAIYSDVEAGDGRQYYDPASASPSLQVHEEQAPNFFAGWHHEWSPGVHTLLLAGRLSDRLDLSADAVTIQTLRKDSNGIVNAVVNPAFTQFAHDYRSEFTAATVEAQQIFESPRNTLIAGVRFQAGEADTRATIRSNLLPIFDAVYAQTNTTDLERLAFYLYDHWRVADTLWLSAGLAYDRLTYPENIDSAPISAGEVTKDQISPKLGLVWSPEPQTSVRGAFTRSLGGLFYDQSVRLEPTLIAGFNQAYRSLIPESAAGPVAGSEFETWQIGFDHRFRSRTYLVWEAAFLKSDAGRQLGVLDYLAYGTIFHSFPSQTRQTLDYEERSMSIAVNQLLGASWSLGIRYRLSESELETRTPQIPELVQASRDHRAVLHQLGLSAIYRHRSGWFGSMDALWWAQSNHGYTPALPGDDFWQVNLLAGYRFPRRRAELAVGLLNLTDQDYRLNPLNLYGELPRHRTFVASFKFNF